METPKIYVACLAAYNNGKLHGTWIDCDQDADDIQAEIEEMLKNSPEPDAEEWAIHASENWYGISISETEDIERLAELAEILEEKGEAYAAYIAHYGESDLEQFEEKYKGEYDSEADFTEQHFKDTNEAIPSHLENYIDWDSMAHDWFIDDYFSADSDNGVFVFIR